MGNVFLNIVNISIAAGWLVAAILILRLLLKRAPKYMHCLLWAIAGLRLIMPFSLQSIFSLIPSAETFPISLYEGRPHIQSGVAAVDNPVNEYLAGRYYEGVTVEAGRFSDITATLAIVWLIGMAFMLLYGLGSYMRLRRRVAPSAACHLDLSVLERQTFQGNVYYCDNIDTPFILGIWKPRIYLPSDMDEAQIGYVLRHENAHLRRKDHWWKPLGFVLLSVYWFHPMMWVAYLLLCRDIELACDEKAIRDMDVQARKGYSRALLSCSVRERRLMVCPLAFGEVGIKDRVKSVLNYKKPAFWAMLAAVIACIGAAVCFLTSPKDGKQQSSNVAAKKKHKVAWMEEWSPWTGIMEYRGKTEYCVGECKNYVYMDSVDIIYPKISLYEEDHSFTFCYSALSSYLPVGTYKLTDTTLTLQVGAEGYGNVYVFDVKDDCFVFNASRSSEIPSYRYSGDSDVVTCPVPDGALFVLEDKSS